MLLRRDILVHDGALSPAECQQIISSTNLAIQAPTLTSVNGAHQHHPARKAAWALSKDDALINRFLLRLCTDLIEPFYKAVVDYWDSASFIVYDPGCFYRAHIDGEEQRGDGQWHRVFNRDLSFSLFLNDGYGGGAIGFPQRQQTVLPKTGRMVVFPSDRDFLHEACEVTSGTRYQLVTWLTLQGTARCPQNHKVYSKEEVTRSCRA